MKTSKSSLFLMELIIVILFFSLASAVCVQLFVKAHMLDDDTVSTTKTTIIMQDLAESFQGSDGDYELLSQVYEGYSHETDSDRLMIYYDENMIAIPAGSDTPAVYAGMIRVEGDMTPGEFQLAHITVYELNGLVPLESIDLSLYVPLVTGQ